MLEVGKSLHSSSCPNPLLKQGHQEPVASDYIQAAFENLQGWRLHNLSQLNYFHHHAFFLPYIQSKPPLLQFITPVCQSPIRHFNKEP